MRPSGRAPRSDARENRARIIEAGRAVFAGDRSASLQAVAKAAGVGQGTMYRHFPDREALLLAVYEEELAALVAAAARLLSGHEPLEALRLWFERLAADADGAHGASLAVDAATRPGRHHPPLVAALELLLRAGKEARQVRPDAAADEVMLLGSCLWRNDGGPACPERGRRMLTVIIDGLRAGAHR
ncbi:AcrR family transcriptional regulator [Streptomyces sp. V3I8]|jgi:AcrR family transcriptional regulator|uniref:TetR/AcrR family transcriptional regulator n=1 Tax=Streptomyces sp. V3I8 TaxID=3042279 RepID=UPI002788EDF3|nr:TetR/AcrR family transcriptional regulator [Streptomyces sp. V3I8]MDQ1033803.1 AcrR family transcriptional regulator [Streptomyces sp. V3I8]